MDFDEDPEDGKLDAMEMKPLLQQMKQVNQGGNQAVSEEASGGLTVPLLMQMGDADGDGSMDRKELVDLLRRMKSYDGGHSTREESKAPRDPSTLDSVGYGESHSQRTTMKKPMKKRRKLRRGNMVKDEP